MNNKKNLLNEELKKFRLLSEYSFYIPKDNIEEADDSEETDLEPTDNNKKTNDVEADVNKVADDLNVPNDTEQNTEETPDLNINDDGGFGDEGTENTDIQPIETPATDEVELDVTQLVQSNEEAKEIGTQNTQKIDQLLNQFNQLSQKLNNMDKINAKIDKLDAEIEKRVPTPKEKLEMRSLDSYPYSIKLTDYWNDKEGSNYQTNSESEKKVFILNKDEINSDYSDHSVKRSFDVNQNDFEEEDV